MLGFIADVKNVSLFEELCGKLVGMFFDGIELREVATVGLIDICTVGFGKLVLVNRLLILVVICFVGLWRFVVNNCTVGFGTLVVD